ncbi:MULTISPECIES: replication protein P [unclassified Halomonas]|uniref:replication protein P n=1 Tax=unclassified Halomonas TaxID=2609666 RepID=UPI0028848298|nr:MULTISPECIES: replication protein P [unclassified Halomonas]MDT0499688.1 replication protein P [Halomonas sp. PAR7]MDT0510495.1 replication protein P [Halomonas sp. LES1]MDT0589796.1 replication protein P [Halomonas sp. PAR8]
MDLVFDALGAMYGAKFSSQWGAYDEGGVWLAELAHLSRRHLELGIHRLRQQVREAARSGDEAWPPQPVAFAALCEPRPEDLGLPTTAEAWAEVCAHAHEPRAHRWRHEAVRLAGNQVGWWELTHGGDEAKAARLEKGFAKHYGALVNRVMAGEDLAPRELLEHDGSRTPAELAERAGREAAQQQAEAAGLPHTMNADQGLRSLRAALNGA